MKLMKIDKRDYKKNIFLAVFTVLAFFTVIAVFVRISSAAERSDKMKSRIGDTAASVENKVEKFIKLAEFETGTEENRLGVLKTVSGKVPFGMFNAPSSFHIDDKGFLYIIDCRNYRVSVFNIKDGCNFVKSINYFTDRDHLSYMSDIAVTPDGSIYLGDNKNMSVVRFSSLGLPEAVFGVKEKAFGGLRQINEIAVDKKNNLYVKDYVQNRVFIFAYDTKYSSEISINSGLCFFSDNSHPYFEYHEDSNSWKIYAALETGEVEKPVIEIKRESPDQNIQFIGIDSADCLYVKTFKRGGIEIIKTSRDGKIIEKIAAHNRPDFDATRYFFIDPAEKCVYAVKYNGNNIQIDRL